MLLQPLPRSLCATERPGLLIRTVHSSAMKCILHLYRCSNVSGVQPVRNFIPLGGYLAAKNSAVTYVIQLLRDTVCLYLYEVCVQECEMISLERIRFFAVGSEFLTTWRSCKAIKCPSNSHFEHLLLFLRSHNSD